MFDTLHFWLFEPIDATRPHVVSLALSWHARFMVIAWVGIVPLAIIVARFFKITLHQNWPEQLDNPFWWKIHWKCQSIALLLTLVALGLLLFWGAGGTVESRHQPLGYLLIGLAFLQGLTGWLRGTKGGPTAPAPDGSWAGDHYDMTRRRLVFEFFHKTLGMALIPLSIAVISLGLWTANAPRWMWLVIATWYLFLLGIVVVLQVTKGAADTYQAIWGPDSAHPGNRMKKRGWGTHRPLDRFPR